MAARLISAIREDRKNSPYSTIVARPDRAGFLAHREAAHRLHRGRACHRAGPQVEARAVARAFHLETEHLAAGEVAAVVGAYVLDRVQVAAEVVDRDRRVAVEHHLEFTRQQFAARAHAHPALIHQAHAGTPANSLRSTSKRRSSRRGMPKRASP